MFHECTKHIKISCHFVRDKIKDKFIYIAYVRSGNQLGDLLSKALTRPCVDYLYNRLGLINIYTPA